MIRNADLETLVTSSAIGGISSGVFTNVLEVIKTKVMNEALTGKYKHARWTHVNQFAHICHCNLCFLRDIFKKDGFRTVFRGVGYQTSMSAVRSTILFPLYELSRIF